MTTILYREARGRVLSMRTSLRGVSSMSFVRRRHLFVNISQCQAGRLCTKNYQIICFLLCRNTHTVRSNRANFPTKLANEKLDKGTTDLYENGKCLSAVNCRALKDTSNKKPKVVHLLSSHSFSKEILLV